MVENKRLFQNLLSPMVSPFSSELHFHILFSFLLKAPKRSIYCLGLLHRDIQTAQTHMLCHCKMNTPSWRSKAKNAEIITLGTWYHPPIKQECNEIFSFQCKIHLTKNDKCSIATLDFLADFHISHICSHKKTNRMYTMFPEWHLHWLAQVQTLCTGLKHHLWVDPLGCGSDAFEIAAQHKNRLAKIGWNIPTCLGYSNWFIISSIFNRVAKFSTKKNASIWDIPTIF